MSSFPPLRHAIRPALAALAFVAMAPQALAQNCLVQIVDVQKALKAQEPAQKPPPSEAQSVGAQDGRQPTPGSLAAAGVSQPDSGAMGALNKAMNLQAAGDEQGCLEALAEARRLGGLQ